MLVPAIISAVKNPDAFRFSCVRNPYHRILSSFFDKICGVQRSSGRYRETLVPFLVENMASTAEQNAGYDEKLLEFEKSGRFYSVLESQ